MLSQSHGKNEAKELCNTFSFVERQNPMATVVDRSRSFIVRRSSENIRPENGGIAARQHCSAESHST